MQSQKTQGEKEAYAAYLRLWMRDLHSMHTKVNLFPQAMIDWLVALIVQDARLWYLKIRREMEITNGIVTIRSGLFAPKRPHHLKDWVYKAGWTTRGEHSMSEQEWVEKSNRLVVWYEKSMYKETDLSCAAPDFILDALVLVARRNWPIVACGFYGEEFRSHGKPWYEEFIDESYDWPNHQ